MATPFEGPHHRDIGLMDSDNETDSNASMKHWQVLSPATYSPLGISTNFMSKADDIDHVIRHVTVRQLLEADQMHSTAPFKIEGKEFKKVCSTHIGSLKVTCL